MSDEKDAKEEEVVSSEEVRPDEQPLTNIEQAMIRFPRREDESEERYAVRMEKVANFMPTLWQKGQSGNPMGPHRKFKNFKTSLEDMLTQGVDLYWNDGEIRNLNRVSRQELFMRNVVDLMVYGEVQLPKFANRSQARKDGIDIEGNVIHLTGKDWADYALKIMRYIAPPLAPEKSSEVTQVVFDLGTFMPKEVRKTIIKQKVGSDAIKYEVDDPDVIDAELLEDGDDDSQD